MPVWGVSQMQGLPVGIGEGYIHLFHMFKETWRKRGLLPDENVEMAEIFRVFFVSVFTEMFRRNINKREISINQNKEKTA